MSNVLVVDSDIDSANLTLFAGVNQRLSWLDAMTQSYSIREAMIASNNESLTLAALRRPLDTECAKRACRLLAQMTEIARKHFDFVVVDLGDVNFLNQSIDVKQLPVDGVVLIHHESDADSPQIELAVLRLRNRGIKPIAIVRNFAT